MAYKLVFKTDRGDFEFVVPSLKEEDLQNYITLKGANKKKFLISRAEMQGIMFYGLNKRLYFEIKRCK